MIDEQVIARAGRLLSEAARPPAKVILFGSHARSEADPESDLDFLVIESEVPSRFDEMLRLRRVLNPLRVPADVMVASASHVEEWGGVEGTLLNAALREGRVLAET